MSSRDSSLNPLVVKNSSTVPEGHPEDTVMSRAFYWLRSFYIPTSPRRLLETQKNMFDKFVRQPVQHKQFVLPSGGFLNYVEIMGSAPSSPGVSSSSRNHPGVIKDSSAAKKPTLILMHGYGSGLGMFFGELNDLLAYHLPISPTCIIFLANYDKFATQFDRIVAIDWLGMGGSSRFKTLPQAPLLWGPFQQTQAVDYFIDSLEVSVGVREMKG